MGTDRSSTYLSGIGVPMERTFLALQSGYYDAGGTRLSALTCAGQRSGYPVPTRETPCAFRSHGEQEAGETITVRCSRAGLPVVDSLGLLWRDTSASDYRGCDPPIRPHTWAPALTAAGHRWPHVIETQEETVIAVYRDTVAAEVQVIRRTAGQTAWGAAITVTSSTSAQDAGPCIVRIPAGDSERLLVLYWRSIGSDYQIGSCWSDDDGLTWTAGGDFLAAPISGTDYTAVYRIRACRLNGEILVLAHVRYVTGGPTWEDVLIQWACSDGGSVAQLVEAWTGADGENAGGWPDIVSLGDRLLVGWLTQDPDGYETAYIAQITRAWELVRTADLRGTLGLTGHYRLSSQVAGQRLWTVAGARISDGDLALWYDTDGHVYATGRDHPPAGTSYCCPVLFSSDLGHTWQDTGADPRYPSSGGEVWWDNDSADEAAYEFTAVAHRSQTIMVTGWYRGGAISGHLASLSLGGMSSVTLPHRNGSLAHTRRSAWTVLWQASCLPAASGWFSEAGGGSDTLLADVAVISGAWTVTSVNLTNSLTDGIIVEVDANANPAGIAVVSTVLHISDGGGPAVSYDIEVRIVAGAQVTIYDQNAAAVVATLAENWDSVRARILVCLAQVAGQGVVQAWITDDRGDDAVWTQIGRVVGLTAGATANTYVEYIVPNACASNLYSIHIVDSTYTGDRLTGVVSTTSLYPRGVTHLPSYLGDGASGSAITGPGIPGDSWVLTPTAEYGEERIDPRNTPSPHQTWRSIPYSEMPAGTREIRLTWEIDSAADAYQLSDLFFCYLDGLNFPDATLKLYYGGAWNSVGAVPREIFRILRAGYTVRTGTTGTEGARNWSHGETDDWGCSLVDTVTGLADLTTTVDDCTQGTTRFLTTQRWKGRLASIVGLGANPYNLHLWPSRALFVVRLSNYSTTISRVQVSIPIPAAATTSPGRPSAGYYEAGVIAFGPLRVLGPRPSKKHTITDDPQVEIETFEDGSSVARERGYHRRSYSIGWPDLHSLHQEITDRDYLLSGTGGEPVAWAHDWRAGVDLIRQLRGALHPCVLIPSVPRPATYVCEVENWAGRSIYGRVMGRITSDADHGEFGRMEYARIADITCEEEV